MEKENSELSAKKIEQLRKQPTLESLGIKSEDWEWIIHKTVLPERE